MAGSRKKIQTYVFFDLETTGLPSCEKQPRITEISLIAVHRHNILADATNNEPRIVDKLTLCVYPMKPINHKSAEITGIYNDTLLYHKDLDDNFVELLMLFLKRHEEPICLVAHNGRKFDFPLLQSELASLDKSLPTSIRCIDSLEILRHLEDNGLIFTLINPLNVNKPHISADKLTESQPKPEHGEQETPSKPASADQPSDDGVAAKKQKLAESVKRQLSYGDDNQKQPAADVNKQEDCTDRGTDSTKTSSAEEVTDKKCEKQSQRTFGLAFPFFRSYKLANIHERVVGYAPPASHKAEDDAMSLVRIFHKLSSVILDAVDTYAIPLDSIKCMYKTETRKPLDPGVFPYQI